MEIDKYSNPIHRAYQWVYALSNVKGPFTLCSANAPRQVFDLYHQKLSEQGIVSPCLLVVEEGSVLGEEELLDVIAGITTKVCLMFHSLTVMHNHV